VTLLDSFGSGRGREEKSHREQAVINFGDLTERIALD
jgi:hypothetical protein